MKRSETLLVKELSRGNLLALNTLFRNDPVDVIVRKLERWYNVDFVLKGNISQDIR